MVIKIYKKLTDKQKNKGVVFSSSLSIDRTEGETIHEVFKDDLEGDLKIDRLLDDKFFNKSPYNFNIIRR